MTPEMATPTPTPEKTKNQTPTQQNTQRQQMRWQQPQQKVREKKAADSSSPKTTEAGSGAGTGGGGEFGISADWRYALSMPRAGGGDDSLRGDVCLGEKEQQRVQEIFRRREATPAGSKVWAPVVR